MAVCYEQINEVTKNLSYPVMHVAKWHKGFAFDVSLPSLEKISCNVQRASLDNNQLHVSQNFYDRVLSLFLPWGQQCFYERALIFRELSIFALRLSNVGEEEARTKAREFYFRYLRDHRICASACAFRIYFFDDELRQQRMLKLTYPVFNEDLKER